MGPCEITWDATIKARKLSPSKATLLRIYQDSKSQVSCMLVAKPRELPHLPVIAKVWPHYSKSEQLEELIRFILNWESSFQAPAKVSSALFTMTMY